MHPEDMLLFGRALFDYNNGDLTSEIILRRGDGFEDVLPAGLFFRSEKDFLPGESEAVTRSKGSVLDIGEILFQDKDGEYLARLTYKKSV